MSEVQRITRTGQFLAEVTELQQLSPRMRRITLTADAIGTQQWPLACDIAIVLAGDDREVRRRYTVREARANSLVVDAVLHGHGPGSTWAAGLNLNDQVTFYGPRGDVPVADGLLLALTDESGLPAIAALAEALGERRIHVIAEIADDAEHYPFPDNVTVEWLPRHGTPPGRADHQLAALSAHHADYVYILGESRAVVVLREATGMPREQVYAKGYWNLNARAGR